MKTRRTNVGGKPFSQRNPVMIGAIGLVFILVVLYASFNASKLPIIGGGTTYTAMFTEDAGLGPNDDVRIAGIKVGTVSSTSLDGALVKVKFKVKNGFVGNQSTVDIKLKTLLGAKYLAIDSIGSDEAGFAPADRRGPHQLTVRHLPGLHRADPDGGTRSTSTELEQSFEVLANDFAGTPSEVKPVLTGLSRLSETIASRDTQLRTLLAKANSGDRRPRLARPAGAATAGRRRGAAAGTELAPRRHPLAAGEHHHAVAAAGGPGRGQPEDDRPDA